MYAACLHLPPGIKTFSLFHVFHIISNFTFVMHGYNLKNLPVQDYQTKENHLS